MRTTDFCHPHCHYEHPRLASSQLVVSRLRVARTQRCFDLCALREWCVTTPLSASVGLIDVT